MMSALALPVAAPMLAAAALMLIRPRWAHRVIGFLVTLGVLGLGAALLGATGDGIFVEQVAGWPGGIAIPLVADTLSALLLVVSAVLVLACTAFAAATGADEHRHFWPLVLLLSAGVYGAYLTGDLFNLFVCIEIMLLPSYVLLTLQGRSDQLAAARIYIPVNLLASTLLITGVALVYGTAGTVNLGELTGQALTSPSVAIAAGVVLLALAVKSAVVPVHGWLPRAYPHAHPAVLALFSGLLTKVGLYAAWRVYAVVFDGDPGYRWLFVAIAVLTMVIGVLGAVGQQNMREILSFHMVSQIGYLVLGIALFTPIGLTAAGFYLVQYVLVKAALLLVAGAVIHGYGTDRLDQLGGLARREPLLAVAFIGAGLSLAGLPPFSGFVAKFALVVAAVTEGEYLAAAVAVAVSLLTLTSMVKIWLGAFWGRAPQHVLDRPRLGIGVAAPALTLTAISLVLGVGAQALFPWAEQAATDLLDVTGYAQAVSNG
ncbi:Na+/H+ antiporter subunit D [Kocuria himachalensis]